MTDIITGRAIVENAVQERRKAILGLYRAGNSYGKIARQIGISRQRVAMLVKWAKVEESQITLNR
jgi:DNA-binding transcriptional regulator LsrR (DeoR family)